MDDVLGEYVKSFKPDGEKNENEESKWLDELYELKKSKPLFHYDNDKLGSPKYENGILNLYKKGMSPQEALNWWKNY